MPTHALFIISVISFNAFLFQICREIYDTILCISWMGKAENAYTDCSSMFPKEIVKLEFRYN